MCICLYIFTRLGNVLAFLTVSTIVQTQAILWNTETIKTPRTETIKKRFLLRRKPLNNQGQKPLKNVSCCDGNH
jgi:hypothetical protein